jgi:hypothetical protein
MVAKAVATDRPTLRSSVITGTRFLASRNKRQTKKMKANEYKLIEQCIESGVNYGWNRAHKHVDYPTPEEIKDQISFYVLQEICEWFHFTNNNKDIED